MTYDKPEITVVGDASETIQGGKPKGQDAGSLTDLNASDCEFDD